MTNIEYRTGDLIKSPLLCIAHGCNAQGVMASGIAKDIRSLYPEVYNDYRSAYMEQGKELVLGQIIHTKVDRVVGKHSARVIFSIITQEYYGRDSNRVYVSYDAIRHGIRQLNVFANQYRIGLIGFPRIGAGLANGDWDTIAGIMEEEASFVPVVYTLENHTNG